jgi:hypothetical protein
MAVAFVLLFSPSWLSQVVKNAAGAGLRPKKQEDTHPFA